MKISALHAISLILLTSLAVAFIAEYFFGYAPCPLCLYQRYIFIALLITIIIPQTRFLFWPIIFASFALNIYHIGLEQHMWEDIFASCHPALTTQGDLEDFRAQFGKDPAIHCGEIQWKVFGISALYWTFALNLIIAALGFLWRRHEKAA